MKRLVLLVLLIILLALIETRWFKWFPKQEREEILYFPSSNFIKALTGGFDILLSDLLWIEANLYFGKHRKTDRSYPYLFHMYDVITELDPKFISTYTFGGMILADDVKNIPLATKLLNKGMANNPERWEIPFVKGFIYYVYKRDYQSASKWFLFASQKENAPELAIRFASWTLLKEKRVELGLRLYLHFYEKATNEVSKEKAIKGIIRIISTQYKNFYKDKKYYAPSLFTLYKEGYLPFIPIVSEGVFKIENGTVVFKPFK
ncbi:MAG: hypothetical protein ABIN61_04430 [candidate division WOR-3 bacterium]